MDDSNRSTLGRSGDYMNAVKAYFTFYYKIFQLILLDFKNRKKDCFRLLREQQKVLQQWHENLKIWPQYRDQCEEMIKEFEERINNTQFKLKNIFCFSLKYNYLKKFKYYRDFIYASELCQKNPQTTLLEATDIKNGDDFMKWSQQNTPSRYVYFIKD